MTAPDSRCGLSDEQVEQTIGNLLRFGLAVATAVVLAGAAVYLARHGSEQPHYGLFRGEPAALRGLGGIVRGAMELGGRGLIQLGLLLLMATPVARVAFSIAAFAVQRDRLYVLVTTIVLGVLLYGIAGAYLP